MIQIIIWLAALLCPNPAHTIENHGNCNMIHLNSVSSTNSTEEGEGSGDIDTGGETGGHQPPTTPPPPPPRGN